MEMNPKLIESHALIAESLIEAIYGEPVIACPLCKKILSTHEGDRHRVVEQQICEDCSPTPSKSSVSSRIGDPSPWLENAVRALEDW